MTDASSRKKVALGCLGIPALLIICAAVWLLPGVPGTRRIPNEIALGSLLQAQISALNAGWTLSPVGHFTSDSDITRGLWVYEAEFLPYTAWLQFHAFRNPYLAKRWFPPSSIPFDFDKDGNPPIGWSYVPPNADRFIIDCTPEAIPDNCHVFILYREYSLIYRTDVAGAMTLADLQHMLEVTDQFMADFMSNTRLVLGERSIPTLSELGLQPSPD